MIATTRPSPSVPPGTATADVAALRGRLVRFARRHLGDAAAAEDVAQEALLRLYRQHPPVSATAAEAWSVRTARNLIIDARRARRPSAWSDGLDVAVAGAGDDDDEAAEAGRRARRGLAGCVVRFADKLPEPFRQAVVMTDVMGLRPREVAGRIGLSPTGAKSRVQRGRAQLRRLLDACCRFDRDGRGNVMDFHARGATPRCDEHR